jgi:hypothetical protein
MALRKRRLTEDGKIFVLRSQLGLALGKSCPIEEMGTRLMEKCNGSGAETVRFQPDPIPPALRSMAMLTMEMYHASRYCQFRK